MTMNFRSVSFAILSGALVTVGSSMAFANPDQTNPRETAPSADAAVTNSVTVSQPQDASVTAGASSSTAAANLAVIESEHDARKDRNRLNGH